MVKWQLLLTVVVELLSLLSMVTSTMETAFDESVPLSISAYYAKATIPRSPVQAGGYHMN